MRHKSLTAAFLLLLPAGVRAGEADEARAVLERAVKALGGPDKLNRWPDATFRARGQFKINDEKIDFSGDLSVKAQNRYRWGVEVTVEGRTRAATVVLDGDKGWFQIAGREKSDDLPKEIRDIFRVDFRAVRLAQRLTPLLDKDVRLSHLGELKINGRTAVGVKAAPKDMPEIDLWFDKETCLPVRAQVRVRESEQGEVEHTFDFADYKEFNGLKQFTKLTLKRGDQPAMEMELSEFQFSEKLDDSLFARP
jgi:outer membrane lipoprotein-sorting protein